jgi:hypothetical protein
MIGESALHVTDGFDREWALETVDIAADVFDLVWLAILGHHPAAFDAIDKLSADYPVLKSVFEEAER